MSELITCMKCRKKRMSIVTESYRTEVKHDGRPYNVELPALSFYRCQDCPESIVLPDAAEEAIGVELRKVAGLLSPERIKEIRGLAGSQKRLAELLDISESTVCRWETGAQIQQRCFDKMLRAYEEVPAFRDYLEGKKAQTKPTNGPEATETARPESNRRWS